MLARRDTSPPATEATTKAQVSLSAGNSEALHPMANIWRSKNKNKIKIKKRFSDEQIRSLESMFETESRPEPQIKQQLANELGLQPHQVAIWFQNRRARSKSKLIEQEYNMLKASYDTLASKFDSLKKENQCLLIQLQRLRNLMGMPQGSRNSRLGQTGKRIDEDYDNTDPNSEAEEKTNLLLHFNNHEYRMPLCADSSKNLEYFGEDIGILKMGELVPDGSLTSSGNWCSFESSFMSTSALDYPSCSSQWWEI